MTNKEAIFKLIEYRRRLERDFDGTDYTVDAEPFDMAIDALKAQPKSAETVAKDIATIIENEKDMRVIAKNAEPERKTGRWVFSPDHAEGICTVCQYKIYGIPYQGHYLIVPYNFCPNCGCRMEDNDETD